jgi:glycosyltransferase involved in cell wall biosynthesis
MPSAYRLEWMDDPWADVEASGRWLMRLADDFVPDLVHLNSFGPAVLPWAAPVVLSAHSCVYSWWRAVKGEAAPSGWARYGNLVNCALRCADLVITPTAAMAADLKSCHSAAVDCVVIANGRDPARFQSAKKEPFVFSAGRLWDEAKNLMPLSRVNAALPWPVYLAGDSRPETLAGCHSLGILSSRDIRDWFARASIYAMPAKYEPFGLSILEAALSECALVLGDIPSLRENWRDAALFVNPADDNAIAETIRHLIGSDEGRVMMGRRARERALHFTAARMADAYLAAYADAVSARRTACTS